MSANPDTRAAAADRSEQRARHLIADGMPEQHAVALAADETLDYACGPLADRTRRAAVQAVIAAYHGNTYRLLRDLADVVGASIAYVDRAAIEAHLERRLSDVEWAATNDRFSAMELDDVVGDECNFRTEWIETVLAKAGVPGYGYTADGQPAAHAETGAA
jgi:hypothetical protein